MSIQELAKYGRNGDNMMMHVSDREVAGLDALARANGTELTRNPVTGAPEAFNLLPTIAGIAGGMLGGPLGAAAASGAVTTAQTGSIEQGLAAAAMSGAGSAIGGNLAEIGAGTTDAAGNAIAGSAGETVTSTVPQVAPTAGFSDSMANTLVSPPTATGGAPVYQAPQIAPNTMPPNAIDTGLNNLTAGNLSQSASDTMAGAKDVFSNTDNTTAFLKANQGNIALGGMGMAGQAALEDAEAQKNAQQKMEADKFGEAQRSWQQIASTYGKYGKSPTAGMQSYASKYGVNFREGRQVKSPEQQAYEDQVMERYRAQVAEEPAYTRIPVEILDYFGVKDPYRLRRAIEADKQEAPVDKRAAGGYLEGGIASLKGDGMSDSVPAQIDGSQPAALSTGEYVVPADVVSHLGNGSSDDGAVRLDEMLDRVRMARTGTEDQAPQIEADKYLPA